MRHYFLFPIILCLLSLSASAQSTGIAGNVTDDSGQPAINASVMIIAQATRDSSGTITDIDGNYQVLNLSPGKYTVRFAYLSSHVEITDVTVVANELATVNGRVTLARQLSGVTVTNTRYAPPMISPRSPGSTTTMTKEQIDHLPTVTTTGAVYSNGAGVVGAGARASGTKYIIDGVQLSPGNSSFTNLPPGSVDQVTVLSGGTPVDNTESYQRLPENNFKQVNTEPLSTMSVDVDHASYTNVRRFLSAGELPPPDAVRVEEMINYFTYDYKQPQGDDPVSITTEMTVCPWNRTHRLLHIGLQAKTISPDHLPPANLVFLIDVSGSMGSPDKLPLVKESLKLLVNKLRDSDRVAIVVYAGNAGLVLPSTNGSDKAAILHAIDNLEAGGSTAGGAGIELAYKVAQEEFIKGGNNRVILATDGDFNVGVSDNGGLEDLIVKERNKGIFLTVLGFGTGNYMDDKMEILADKGNGNHSYIDNIREAEKTLVSEFGGTLFTVAKDVKAQIEFNPALVQGYRLIGYENRLLNTEDFKDDKKDAGDMGSGHTVTILYELIPAGANDPNLSTAVSLKYQKPVTVKGNGEIATIKFRYKQPDGNVSKEMIWPIADVTEDIMETSDNLRFSSAVALFGMILRHSQYISAGTLRGVMTLAQSSITDDTDEYRDEFVELVKDVQDMQRVGVR